MFLFERDVIIHAQAVPFAIAVDPGEERAEEIEVIAQVGLVGEVVEDEPPDRRSRPHWRPPSPSRDASWPTRPVP